MAEERKETKDLEEQLFREFNENLNINDSSEANSSSSMSVSDENLFNLASELVEETPVVEEEDLGLGSAFADLVEDEDFDYDLDFDDDLSGEFNSPKVQSSKSAERLKQLFSKVNVKSPLLRKVGGLVFAKAEVFVLFTKKFTLTPITWFKNLEVKEKIVVLSIFSMFLFTLLSAHYVYQKIFTTKEPYLQSFTDLEGSLYTYEKEQQFEPFFSKAHMPDYIYILPLVKTNIKPSANSGSNPMILVELVLNASNQETAVEIKDRELTMVDRAARTMESYTFDEMQSTEGKLKLKKDLKNDFNLVLNKGNVIQVMYNTFIVKP